MIISVDGNTPASLPSVVLPFPVNWRQWKTAVVPVLEDEMWRGPIIQGMLKRGETTTCLQLLGSALRVSFEEAGWGP